MSRNVSSTSNISEDIDPSTREIVEKIKLIMQHLESIIGLMEKKAPKNEETPSNTAPEENLSERTRVRRLKLYRAALNGDWEVAKRIFDDCEEGIGVKISRRGETVLHIAAAAERIDFVKEVVKKMNENDLALEDKKKHTALFWAAASKNVDLAKEMLKNNQELAKTRDENGTLPIHMAASLGRKEMVEYLYKETRGFLNEMDRAMLFVTSIETDLYDFALQLLGDHPDLATARTGNEETALHALARKHPTFSNFANQNQQGIFRRCVNIGVQNKKQALQLVELIWEKVVLLSHSELSDLIKKPRKLIFDAAERGNVEFLSILIRGYPDLIWKVNGKNSYSIFHVAVENRQEKVFNLINEMGSSKDILLEPEDEEGNNILHLAGKLAPKDRLNIVSGAALQMQRELLWFKEVEKVVQPSLAEATNNGGLTPRALFTEKHEGLREKGEKWMKETATSCMVVAALIATVAFAAAITVPGGNNGDTGFPFFLEKVSFKIFAISDAISLVSSSASITNFLSILTSRYAEDDFIRLLPRKLRIGLVTLFISMTAMMVMFTTTYFIVFENTSLWISIVLIIIASTPVIMFIWQHFQLFYDVLRSTYGSISLFQKRKTGLFRKEGEASDQRLKSKMFDARLKIHCTCSSNV